MFEAVSAAPPDPILGLGEAFLKDPRQHKVNLTIGVYKDAQGQTPVLDCVKKAETLILDQEKSKGYLGIDGLSEFNRLAAELSLGGIVPLSRIAVAQSPGGTGALKVAADFLSANFRGPRVWCSNPTWPNHISLFEVAGLSSQIYPYLAADKCSIDFASLLDKVEREGKVGDVICLHACCHNPSGLDPDAQQWAEIAELTAARGMLPLIDFAYHGFGDGLEEDRVALKAIADKHEEFILCSSFSKNFGLYSERVGAVMAVCKDDGSAERVSSRIKQAVRSNYSNPPRHGGAIVATVLGNATLRSAWELELAAMRNRIHDMRSAFVNGMKEAGCDVDFSFLLGQKGMFSFSGLTPMQVDWLRTEKAVYIVGSGRINVAGITPGNLMPLCQAITEAMNS
ncbi:MAG: aspartate/tyrosine/aromatic aminotransferase [Planctomycetales bacterium]|nr:aspartate/tyrosine/aromatic aminotransferase [Planctomycetales bacterium]